MAYSIDFIRKAVEYKQKGHTFKQLKDVFGIPNETYYQWKEKLESGFYERKKPRQERKRKIDKEKLRQAVKENPDSYLHELAKLFGCSFQAVFAALKKMGITLKKRPLPTVKNPKKNARSIKRQ
jgi:transposase